MKFLWIVLIGVFFLVENFHGDLAIPLAQSLQHWTGPAAVAAAATRVTGYGNPGCHVAD